MVCVTELPKIIYKKRNKQTNQNTGRRGVTVGNDVMFWGKPSVEHEVVEYVSSKMKTSGTQLEVNYVSNKQIPERRLAYNNRKQFSKTNIRHCSFTFVQLATVHSTINRLNPDAAMPCCVVT